MHLPPVLGLHHHHYFPSQSLGLWRLEVIGSLLNHDGCLTVEANFEKVHLDLRYHTYVSVTVLVNPMFD
jgi:hypothetical protein